MKKILSLLTILSVTLIADFKTIDIVEFEKLQKEGLPIIDIRTPEEWKTTGIIKGAHKIMFFTPQGQPNLTDWFFELGHLIKDKKSPFIIYCAHASRTKVLGEGLIGMGFENIYELKGGIENGWIKDGKKTVEKVTSKK